MHLTRNLRTKSYVFSSNRGMRFALLFCFVLALQAQTEMNVDQLAQFVRSELALKQQSDKQIAAYVKKNIHLNEKLTDKTIEDLEAQGAGPRTVEALQALRDETANLKPPSHDATFSPATAPDNTLQNSQPSIKVGVSAPIPPPNSVRQQEILDEIRQYAMNYTANLPNFICLQVTRQYVDPDSSDHFRIINTINAQLSYHEGEEEHRVISVNGKLQNVGFFEATNKTGGAISTGEFGGMMRSIFDPKSDAAFNWDHWGTWDGKRMAVFNYFIDSGHSDYHITYENSQQIITAYKGLVYADQYTGVISRLVLIAVDIPRSFPVNEASEDLIFGDAVVNGQTYNCPLKADLRLRSGRQRDKNEIEFRLYRKFGTESNIVYGAEAPPPLPDSQTQEQPASASPAKPAPPAEQKQANNPFGLPTPPPPPQ